MKKRLRFDLDLWCSPGRVSGSRACSLGHSGSVRIFARTKGQDCRGPFLGVPGVWRQPSLKGHRQYVPAFAQCSSPQTPMLQSNTIYLVCKSQHSCVALPGKCQFCPAAAVNAVLRLLRFSHPNCKWDGTGIVALALQWKWDRKARSGEGENC